MAILAPVPTHVLFTVLQAGTLPENMHMRKVIDLRKGGDVSNYLITRSVRKKRAGEVP